MCHDNGNFTFPHSHTHTHTHTRLLEEFIMNSERKVIIMDSQFDAEYLLAFSLLVVVAVMKVKHDKFCKARHNFWVFLHLHNNNASCHKNQKILCNPQSKFGNCLVGESQSNARCKCFHAVTYVRSFIYFGSITLATKIC